MKTSKRQWVPQALCFTTSVQMTLILNHWVTFQRLSLTGNCTSQRTHADIGIPQILWTAFLYSISELSPFCPCVERCGAVQGLYLPSTTVMASYVRLPHSEVCAKALNTLIRTDANGTCLLLNSRVLLEYCDHSTDNFSHSTW